MRKRTFHKKNNKPKLKARRHEGYASYAEYRRALELEELWNAGTIMYLEKQVPFELNQEGPASVKYVADFMYQEVSTGRWIVEEQKGFFTDLARVKCKFFYSKFVNITKGFTFLISRAKYKQVGKKREIVGFDVREYEPKQRKKVPVQRKRPPRPTREKLESRREFAPAQLLGSSGREEDNA